MRNTVNIRNPIMQELPAFGSPLTSPQGDDAWIAGSAGAGKLILITMKDGQKTSAEVFPAQLRGYRTRKGAVL